MTNEEYAIHAQNGDQNALEMLWKNCHSFIRSQAMRWNRAFQNRPCFDDEDLTQAGYFALLNAVSSYDPSKGMFLTYLAFHLKTAFADVCGCRSTAQMKAPENNALSLDRPITADDADITLGDTVPSPDNGIEHAEESLYIQQLRQYIDEALASSVLTDKQSIFIREHYLHGKPYAAIAGEWGCSASYPRELISNGLRKLRTGQHAPILSEMLCGDPDYYAHTGFQAWKQSGCSVQEWALIRHGNPHKGSKEQQAEQRRQRRIEYVMNDRGMTRADAERLFPPAERKYI